MAFDVVKAREDIARAMLRNRELEQQFRDAALAGGDIKEARKWAAAVRKTEKLIAQYGLDRHA